MDVQTASLGLVILIVVLALVFDYVNGFHDAANSIATVVATRVLSPGVAVAWAAFFNFIAFLVFGTAVAKTIGGDMVNIAVIPPGDQLYVLLGGILGAITWNLITWYFGLPTSSSHALIGGLVGAAIVASATVKWLGVLEKVVIPMILSPLVGFLLAYLLMIGLLWAFRRGHPGKLTRGFRY